MLGSRRDNSIKRGIKINQNLYYFSETLMLDCNQYVINDPDSNELALFDAGNGISLNGLIKGMKELDLEYKNITKIFLTHEHVDHVLGLYKLMEILKDNPPDIFAYGETSKIIQKGDESQIFPGNLGINPRMFGVEITPLKVNDIEGINEIGFGQEFNFQIHYTPGHSIGSVSFFERSKKILIPGDLVFAGGSFGRYDFPGGSLTTLQESIKFVNDLDVKYLLPGHMGISDKGNQQINLSNRIVQSLNF